MSIEQDIERDTANAIKLGRAMNRIFSQFGPPRQIAIRRLGSHDTIAQNVLGEYGVNRHNQWAWIQRSVAFEFSCPEEVVSVLETDQGENITICGKPVAYVVRF